MHCELLCTCCSHCIDWYFDRFSSISTHCCEVSDAVINYVVNLPTYVNEIIKYKRPIIIALSKYSHDEYFSFSPSFPSSLPPFLPPFLPLFLPSFLPLFLPSFLPLFLPSFLPSFLPIFLLPFRFTAGYISRTEKSSKPRCCHLAGIWSTKCTWSVHEMYMKCTWSTILLFATIVYLF